MDNSLVLGTRGSGLALTQSRWVAASLMAIHPGLGVQLKIIRTKGDRLQRRGATSGVLPKGLFTAELERALLAGAIDLAVHSLKDLPVDDPPGLAVAAVPERASAHDVLITRGATSLGALPERPVIATGSPRRRLEILRIRPDANVIPIRGNVDTRIEKLRRNAEWHAIVLAEAGISRLGPDLSGLAVTAIPFEHILPAPGQGALAIQARATDPKTCSFVGALDHGPTRIEVAVERAFLRGMGGGCGIPLGARARADGQYITLEARLYDAGERLKEFREHFAADEAVAKAETFGRLAVSA